MTKALRKTNAPTQAYTKRKLATTETMKNNSHGSSEEDSSEDQDVQRSRKGSDLESSEEVDEEFHDPGIEVSSHN